MATSIIINATTVKELRAILEEMCGTGQAQLITVGDVKATPPDTPFADAQAASDKAAADKKAADAKKAAAKKIADDAAAALKALEADAPEEPVVLTSAIVREKIAEVKAGKIPDIVSKISGMKKEKGWPSLDDMSQAQWAELMAFMA